MKLKQETLKEILLKSGFVDEKELKKAVSTAKEMKKSLEDVLIFRGLITEKALGQLVAEHLNVPFISLSGTVIPENVLNLIPERLARNYRILPFKVEKDNLHLAMEDPKDFEVLEFAKRKTGKRIVPYLIMEDDLSKSLGQYKKSFKKVFKENILENIEEAQKGKKEPNEAAEEIPVIKLLDTLIEFAAAERASDIHLESFEGQVIVRFRIDGVLQDIINLPKEIQGALVARIKILASLKIDEHRVPQDGRFKFEIDNESVALRVSVIPGFYGENVVMRLLTESARPLGLSELGLRNKNLELIRNSIEKPHGMILVTGPTGSGKTTTLYSILNILNTIKVKICTIEDPIEYGMQQITQTQVNPKAGLTFAAGLRSLLRHDPDIIMVGEIRDEETAEISIHSSLTGHLVLSTLHTNDAAGAIPRFLDMGAEGYLVASTINSVIAQRLVRKICRSCIEEYQPEQKTLDLFSKELGEKVTKQKFYRGKGCEECRNTGYRGRIGVFEILPFDEEIRELTIAKSSSDKIKKVARQKGMVTLMEDGLNKVAAGLTTIDEVLRVLKD